MSYGWIKLERNDEGTLADFAVAIGNSREHTTLVVVMVAATAAPSLGVASSSSRLAT